MSFDITLTTPSGRTCPTCGETPRHACVGEWSPTYNFAPMFVAAGLDLLALSGWTAADVAPVLRAAIARMREEPARFRSLEASNGWGTYDEALPLLDEMLLTMELHPDAVLRVT